MLKTINFIKGTCAGTKGGLLETWTHVDISNGRITGTNGALTASAKIDTTVNAKPAANVFIKAVISCGDDITFSKTKSGRLKLTSPTLTVFADCYEDELDFDSAPNLELATDFDGATFIAVLKKLLPVIPTDYAPLWAKGVLCKNKYCYVASKITFLRHELPFFIATDFVLPYAAVKELLRIKEAPVKYWYDNEKLYFFYRSNKWLSVTPLFEKWPDVEAHLEKHRTDDVCDALAADFFDKLLMLKPFLTPTKEVYFGSDTVATSAQNDTGAKALLKQTHDVCFNAEQLLALETLVDTIDFAAFPAPCSVSGPNVIGLIAGIQKC